MTSTLLHPTEVNITPGGTPLPQARGALSASILDFLTGRTARIHSPRSPHATAGGVDDDDFQLAFWLLNVTQSASFDGVDDRRPTSLRAQTTRWYLAQAMEDELRRQLRPVAPVGTEAELRDHLTRTRCRPQLGTEGRPAALIRAFAAKAPYLAWEADPHTLALAHVEQPLKQPLGEIQAGEYGVGFDRTHAQIYRECLEVLGVRLQDALDHAPAAGFALANLAWLFGSDRRLRGAAVGQLCLFETDSVAPCRAAVDAWERAGLPRRGRRWYEVHVMADDEHADVIEDRLLPLLCRETPWLIEDAAFGMTATAYVEDALGVALVTLDGAPVPAA